MSNSSSTYILTTLQDFDSFQLVTRALPDLNENEVLVKMECSTINPSDYLTIQGNYPISSLPMYMGYEGSGTVIKAGSSPEASSLLHKRVAVLASGSWGEYNIADYNSVFPLQDHVTFEQAADLIINPMTVAYMIEIAQSLNSAFVQNAAASSLGLQLTKLATRLGIRHVNLVRRPEQVQLLRDNGAEFVFNTSEDGWVDKVREVVSGLKPKLAFDAVGGKDSEVIARFIENGGKVYSYGMLSGQNPEFNSAQLIFQQKTLTGLWIVPYLFGKNLQDRRAVGEFVQRHIDVLANKYTVETDLNGLKGALMSYMKNSTGNKVLVRTRLG